MLKAVKHLSRNTALYIFCAFFGTMAYAIFFKLLFGTSEKAAGSINGIIFGVCTMLCFALLVSVFSTFGLAALTMSVTRRDLFLGIQVQKIFTAVGIFLTLFVNNKLLAYLFGGDAQSLETLVLYAALCIFFASIGETIGVLCVRFGKLGLYLYLVICALFGGFVGIIAVMDGMDEAIFLTFITGLSAFGILAIVLAFAIIVTFINWLIFKKTSVKL